MATRSTSKKTAKRAPVTAAAKAIPIMTAPAAGVKVRMYRQGLGDCFLLAFRGKAGKPCYVLIDCGLILGQVAGRPDIRTIASHIAASTNNRLDIIIATHEHWDHLSGFVDAKDIFGKMQVGAVWMAWTEKPSDSLAKKLREKRTKAHDALRKASTEIKKHKNSMAGADAEFGMALENVLGFLGDADGERTTEAALGNLRAFLKGKEPRYCSPDDNSMELPGVKGVRMYFLGPPHDEQKIRAYNDKKSDPQTYRVAEMALANQTAFLAAAFEDPGEAEGATPKFPFDDRYRIQTANNADRFNELREAYFGGDLGWRAISVDWLRAAAALAMNLDNATNNTSLAIAIELGPKGNVLLFPADAQVGSWLSWHDQNWKDEHGRTVSAEDLLSRTVLYKVGHHGSHNATLRQRGLELMTHEDLMALVPLDHKTAEKKKWPMPWPKLLKSLSTATKGRILQVDDSQLPSQRACPAGTPSAVWKKFQQSISGDQNYFEVTIR